MTRLTLNGVERSAASPLLTPLLHVLREEFGVTGPKAGCQQGGCGTCTVLVDGEPRRSCLLPLAAVDGASITTVEGLGAPERLSPVQAAFHEQYGSQCGFCTPGFLVATHALLERTPSPSRHEIEQALNGHICRCTGYVKILAAVEAAARGEVGVEAAGPTLDDASPDEPDVLVPGSPA
jgi:aerobic-type carbon monoxide dehydrogenase small subunit (CoxS/CutS family)